MDPYGLHHILREDRQCRSPQSTYSSRGIERGIGLRTGTLPLIMLGDGARTPVDHPLLTTMEAWARSISSPSSSTGGRVRKKYTTDLPGGRPQANSIPGQEAGSRSRVARDNPGVPSGS